jgi:GT2 family glycosyltransferase
MKFDKLSKTERPKNPDNKFSIIIPTWNNLDYLKLCIGSVEKNSSFKHQIIVMINEGNDGTEQWLKSQAHIDYVSSTENIGICYGLNICRPLATTDYILYLNDDMYVLPDWDLELWKEIEAIGHNQFMLSATMIEPNDTNNKCVIVDDYGDDLKSFK